jgi:hypothetical protein
MWRITRQAVAETSCRRGFRHPAQCFWHAHSHTTVIAETPAVRVVAQQQRHSGAATAASCGSTALLKRCLEPHACGRKRQWEPGGTGRRWADAEFCCLCCLNDTDVPAVPCRSICSSQPYRTVDSCLAVHHLAGFLRLAPAGSSAADVGWQVRRGALPASGQVISPVHKADLLRHHGLAICALVMHSCTYAGENSTTCSVECAKQSWQSMRLILCSGTAGASSQPRRLRGTCGTSAAGRPRGAGAAAAAAAAAGPGPQHRSAAAAAAGSKRHLSARYSSWRAGCCRSGTNCCCSLNAAAAQADIAGRGAGRAGAAAAAPAGGFAAAGGPGPWPSPSCVGYELLLGIRLD